MDFAKSPGTQDTIVVAVSIVFFIVGAEDRKKKVKVDKVGLLLPRNA